MPFIEKPVQNIYIGDSSPYTPWANTIIYYPLISNLVDKTWNWNTWVMTWTCTFDSSTGIHVTWTSWNYVTWMSNWIAGKRVFTMNVWVKIDSGKSGTSILWYDNAGLSRRAFKLMPYQTSSVVCAISYWGGVDSANLYATSSRDTNRHNYCLVWTWSSYSLYYDGSWAEQAITNYAINDISELQLWWWWAWWSTNSADGYIKDYIVETIARTADEIVSYYNKTKSNYGY